MSSKRDSSCHYRAIKSTLKPKCVYALKDGGGEMIWYKARLVAEGNSQISDTDYMVEFSPCPSTVQCAPCYPSQFNLVVVDP